MIWALDPKDSGSNRMSMTRKLKILKNRLKSNLRELAIWRWTRRPSSGIIKPS